jgi:hypothetical protein
VSTGGLGEVDGQEKDSFPPCLIGGTTKEEVVEQFDASTETLESTSDKEKIHAGSS